MFFFVRKTIRTEANFLLWKEISTFTSTSLENSCNVSSKILMVKGGGEEAQNKVIRALRYQLS